MKRKDKIIHLGNGEILFKGIKYPGFRAYSNKNFDPKKWILFWEKLIEEIKSSELDYKDIIEINDEFRSHIFLYGACEQMKDYQQKVIELITLLNFAFIKSHNNFIKNKGKLWAFLFGWSSEKILSKLKIPELNKLLSKD
ncbi:MAG: hypothetical protein ACOCUU_03935 [Nanoarchaeota archaeon]